MEELKNIIKEIQSYKKALSMVLSDDMILDCATRIFNSGNIKMDKQDSLTDKQKSMLIKLNYKGDVSVLTKKEASVLIDEEIKRLKEDDNGKRGSKY